MLLPVLMITAIGLVCAILIYVAFVKIPQKVQGLEKTEAITAILPGRNCAACGFPGCFGFAQALTADPEIIKSVSCPMMSQDPARLARLGKELGITLDASSMAKKAMIRCAGNSPEIFEYSGIKTCKAAAQLLAGTKKCPFACLGLGDCVAVCPEGAIKIDEEKKVAVIDWDKCTGCGLCVKECPKGVIELVSAGTKIAHRCSYTPLRPIPGRERCELGCTHCMRCLKACPSGAITWNKEKGFPVFDIEKCTLCLECVKVCPTHVLEQFAPAKEKEAVAA